MKIYTKEVNHCTQCPACGDDINVTRWLCYRMNHKFIMWMGEHEDTEPIPDWCPLPTKEEIGL
jgi:hypothetical protein